MSRQIGSDLIGVIKGIQMVASESIKHQENYVKHVWANSSVKALVIETNFAVQNKFCNGTRQSKSKADNTISETIQRTSMIPEGFKALVHHARHPDGDVNEAYSEMQWAGSDKVEDLSTLDLEEAVKSQFNDGTPETTIESSINIKLKFGASHFVDPASIEANEQINKSERPIISSGLLNSIETQLKSKESSENITAIESITQSSPMLKNSPELQNDQYKKFDVSLDITKSDLANGLSEGHTDIIDLHPSQPLGVTTSGEHTAIKKKAKLSQQLNETAKQRKVPASRVGRMFSFGTLAAGLGIGTVAEMARRKLGLVEEPKHQTLDSIFLTPANAERIVNTLCKVRGAALKIGQLLSIQDSNVINPVLQEAFERVRQSADFMPKSQVESVLKSELGKDWRRHFSEFNMIPFAAASIGQVHYGRLVDEAEVAVKIQYPGVAEGINSDIDNLVSVLKVWDVFPSGMFIDKLIEVAKRELSWEVDYIREAECTQRFRELLEPYSADYYVPRVIDEVCSKKVFTTELIEGVPVDKFKDFDLEARTHICKLIMHLCLRELFEFRYMQTDPNWSNFFYNVESKKLILLDFGASRSYDKKFMDNYMRVIKGTADKSKEQVLELSRKMGFLTGFESKAMEDAHVETLMILGEVFTEKVGEFDFGAQDTIVRITHLVPTILKERLCPPPEEIYSLHRKLSGVFLLCSKLKVKICCRDMFLEVYDKYKFEA